MPKNPCVASQGFWPDLHQLKTLSIAGQADSSGTAKQIAEPEFEEVPGAPEFGAACKK